MRHLTLFLAAALAALSAAAADSPQFRGPHRTGVFPETGLLTVWPEGGPEKAWVVPGLGRGYSSAAVADGKIYVTGADGALGGRLFVLGLDGSVERTLPYGPEADEEQAPGPRATPTVDGGRAFLLSGPGVVYCLDVRSGEKVWEADLTVRFGAPLPMFQFAESPLVNGGLVYCTPGAPGALLAALDKDTGATVWTLGEPQDTASYCSPVLFTHNGRSILSTATGGHILGVEPASGTLLWAFGHKARLDTHVTPPLYGQGLVYYVSGEDAGGGALELSPDGGVIVPKWADKTLDCLHTGVVLVNGHLYGTGFRVRKLVCLELATGKVMWATKEVGEGATVAADGMLYVYEGPKKGVVSLVKADPSGFVRTGQFAVTDGTDQHWAHPTIANGHLYIRHGDALVAYRVSAGAK